MEIANGLGPRPRHAGPRPAPLSGPRHAVLDAVARARGPVTVAGLAADLGLHPNTAREHLDALAEQGLLRRDRARAQGRGRPGWRYEAVSTAADPRVREYAGLAAALAGHLHRTSASPTDDALEAGRAWGADLARGASTPDGGSAAGEAMPERADSARADGDRAAGEVIDAATAATARRRVVHLLADLGFDPAADDAATTVALRSCPLLETARRYPDVVCSVHLGITRGALEAFGGDPGPTDLRAFAEPGACRLLLETGAHGG